MEWKTQRYEGSVGVDGRWVVSRSEAEARAEAAERERDNAIFYEGRTAAKLAAVREWCDKYSPSMGPRRIAELLAILDGEGEK